MYDKSRLLTDPSAPDREAYLIRDARGGVVTTFVTGGVNGKTADETAMGNLSDASEYLGKVTLYKGGALPTWSNGSVKIAEAEYGGVRLVRDLDAEIRAAGDVVEEAHPGSLEWARAHAELERLVYEKAGILWSREEHFVTRMERETA